MKKSNTIYAEVAQSTLGFHRKMTPWNEVEFHRTLIHVEQFLHDQKEEPDYAVSLLEEIKQKVSELRITDAIQLDIVQDIQRIQDKLVSGVKSISQDFLETLLDVVNAEYLRQASRYDLRVLSKR